MLDVLYSENGQLRAVITESDSGLLHVDMQAWDTSDWDYCEIAYWSQVGSTSLTDSLDNARKLASESLVVCE